MFLARWITVLAVGPSVLLTTLTGSFGASYQFRCTALQGMTLPLPSALNVKEENLRQPFEWVIDGHDKIFSGLQISVEIEGPRNNAQIHYLDSQGKLEASHDLGIVRSANIGNEISHVRIDVNSGAATTETYLVSWVRSQIGRVVFVQVRPESIMRNISVFQAACRVN